MLIKNVFIMYEKWCDLLCMKNGVSSVDEEKITKN